MLTQLLGKPVQKYPVNKTGIYLNSQVRGVPVFEYWFFHKGRKAKIGACNTDMPNEVVVNWAEHTRLELQKLVLRKLVGESPTIIAGSARISRN